VLRVAHNVAASHVEAGRRRERPAAPIQDHEPGTPAGLDEAIERRQALALVHELARALPTLDRQVLLLSLEGLTGAEVGEVVGISANAVAIRWHRLKQRLAAGVAARKEDHA
jgi:DNA-directed RNA polymerase specialized sigma24 family protein